MHQNCGGNQLHECAVWPFACLMLPACLEYTDECAHNVCVHKRVHANLHSDAFHEHTLGLTCASLPAYLLLRFGHALQHMLTEVEVGHCSGIRGVEWDAVELPSQFMVRTHACETNVRT